MYDFYDFKKEDPIADIEYVKGLYDAQVNKVKQEEYMKDLLFADYVRKVKCHKSRYDYIENVFKEAQGQVGKKKKKEREQLSVIEQFVRDDFFNNNSNFKIVNIISGGYEGYYWNVEFEYCVHKICISIPNTNQITTKNIMYAHNGMFAFEIKESEHCWSVKKMSYKIEDVAEFIKEYFGLNNLHEDDD